MTKEIYPCTIAKDDNDGWVAYASAPYEIGDGQCSHGTTPQEAYDNLFHLLHKCHDYDAFRIVND